MSFISLPHFPPKDSIADHRSRDYRIAVFTFVTVTICLTTDGFAPQAMQYVLAFFGWVFLLAFLRKECKYVRTQVAVAVTFAVIGEYFASIYMHGYIYRFGNLPAYVPAGHGLVYLTAVALGRSGLFQRHARYIAIFVVCICSLWTLWGISSFSQRQDLIGAVLFGVFLLYLFKGKSPMVYLGAFFITSWLEIVGTSAGTWAWATIDPATRLPQGNPPSGVAAWYCLVDAVAIAGATPVLIAIEKTTYYLRYGHSMPSK
ncbi:hypothetical protein [Methylomonas sp. AM2-LC]|uniref:hypothetical protein n=1 Tax=Methylomonas sp. AM2-LC TaxID=3153301 RepID=UPI003262FDCD